MFHLLQADRDIQRVKATIQRDREWLAEAAIGELTRAHTVATYARSPQEAHLHYQALVRLGTYLVTAFEQIGSNLAAVRAHSLLQDALCVLNRPGEGLYHAKMARAILAGLNAGEWKQPLVYYDADQREQEITSLNLEANALRIEAACYHALGDDVTALALGYRAEKTRAVKADPADLLPHILRDMIVAATHVTTISIPDIEQYANRGIALCEAKGDGILQFLIRRALAKAYLRRRYTKKAEAVLEELW